jgi:hypothetical protein
MKKINIFLIHTDYKFVNDAEMFEGRNFFNTCVIIQSKDPYPKKENEDVMLFNSNDIDLLMFNDIEKANKLINNYRLV